MKIAFVASIAVNLFFLGVLAAALVFHSFMPFGGDFRPAGGPFFSPHGAMEKLAPETRTRLRAVMKEQRGPVRQAMREARAARKNVAAALEATPYSPEKLNAVLAESRAADLRAIEASHIVFLRMVDHLTPEERAQFATALREPRRRYPHRCRDLPSEPRIVPGKTPF